MKIQKDFQNDSSLVSSLSFDDDDDAAVDDDDDDDDDHEDHDRDASDGDTATRSRAQNDRDDGEWVHPSNGNVSLVCRARHRGDDEGDAERREHSGRDYAGKGRDERRETKSRGDEPRGGRWVSDCRRGDDARGRRVERSAAVETEQGYGVF